MLPKRWNVEKFKEALESPELFIKEMKRLPLHTKKVLTREPLRFGTKLFYRSDFGTGFDVMAEDWDNLVILDACRYDSFAEQNTIDGDLSRATSNASATPEFLKKTFAGKQFHDTVCVCPNAKYIKLLEEDTFYKLITDISYDPEEVFEAGLDAHSAYPNKRLIVHFMTPHTPYIGPNAQEIWNRYRSQNPPIDSSLLKAARFGYLTDAELKVAYRENLDIVLALAEKFIESADGKTVVTADHGELLGDRIFGIKDYSHAVNYYVPELRHVPWLEIDSEDRKTITTEESIGADNLEGDAINERLRALGYRA
ncbi:hypothetical protein U4E84_03890 [Halorubrum sp. AD140]|uniref:hypothetical protein n=1 Tax=Halorubrum sp. AD140 TaxID=3050073 RepID=UPI002ACC8314|nr:hypothetical protein [Halorubrum sp. AD140]MDZ5810493.1 hypothetical protein [Halorubrum sp. AD140]